MSFWGSLVSAGANLLGGWMNSNAQSEANQAQQNMAAENIRLQKKFAQEGIQWKVKDAKKAGIHPLYALGASTHSFAPVSVGSMAETGIGDGLRAAGQDLSRAIGAGSSRVGRVDAFTKAMQTLSVEKGALENELLKSQLAKANAQLGPAIPVDGVIPEGKLDNRTPIMAGGKKINTAPGWSDGSTFEDRWGEWGGSAAGLAVMVNDLLQHARSRTTVKRAPWSWLPRVEFK